MLRVEIANIDGGYNGVFDLTDKAKAAEAALANLVEQNKMFEDNLIFVSDIAGVERPPNAHGFLLMPDDEGDVDDIADGECTYWIFITEYKLGTMVSDTE